MTDAGAGAGQPSAGALARALVAEHFGRVGGRLCVDGVPADELVRRHGSPLYAYSAAVVGRRYAALAGAVRGFAEVFYSVKANPNPAISRRLVELGAGLEIASGSEYLLARAAGADVDRILFAGPGKGEEELARVVADGIGEVHVESCEEIASLGAIAAAAGRTVRVRVRVNSIAAAQGGAMRMGGRPAAFGIDEEQLPEALAAISRQPALALVGIHLFAGTQVLDAKVLVAQWRHGLGLAERLGEAIGRPLASIDLGGGLGVPYHEGDPSLDLDAVANGAGQLQAERSANPWLREARIVVEPGRWLVGPAGVYLATVRAVKWSRGQRFVVVDGGMHHHLAASGNLGQIVKRDYPIVLASRRDDAPVAPATVVGPLCTPLDTLGRQTALPELRAGDVLAVLQSGAYGLSASPVGFLGHPMPAEAWVEAGASTAIRARGTLEAPLVNLPTVA